MLDNQETTRYGYKKPKDGFRELAFLPPRDEAIELLTYDLELLIAAVMERRSADRNYYLPPEEIAILSANPEWQTNCRIAEHLVDYVFDYDKIPHDWR
jgi:hypothetical protein